MLGDAVIKVGATFIVIDAITSYMGKVENNSTTDIRSVLDPISVWAEKHHASILGITHPPKAAQKNAIRQFTGSFAYVASARLAFIGMEDPDNKGRSLLLPAKNNLGSMPRGLGYRIATKWVSNDIIAPCIEWDDAPVDYTADQALAASASSERGGSAVDDAVALLKDLLAGGSVDAKEAEEAAQAHSISERTLRRAKKILGVEAVKAGFEGGWKWTLKT